MDLTRGEPPLAACRSRIFRSMWRRDYTIKGSQGTIVSKRLYRYRSPTGPYLTGRLEPSGFGMLICGNKGLSPVRLGVGLAGFHPRPDDVPNNLHR